MPEGRKPLLHLALPKGHMQENVFALLAEAGIRVRMNGRGYRPSLSLPGFEVKLLKPQNIVEMLQAGSRDAGITGADWVQEQGADLVEVLDTGLDPVRLVAAAPLEILVEGQLPRRPLVVASEYERLTRRWIEAQGIEARFVRSYGATEVFPPEDADLIIDNTATGATLHANELTIVDELMTSSTRLYAHPGALEDPAKKAALDDLALLLQSVLEARRRVMLEVNVPAELLEQVIAVLPAMQQPTVAPLHGDTSYAVRAAVRREELPRVIPEVKARGGRDLVVSSLSQIVP